MATYTERGDVQRLTVTTGSANKVVALNTNDQRLDQLNKQLDIDLAGESGTELITEANSRYGIFLLTGARSGALNLDVDTDSEHAWWINDQSTGTGRVTFRRDGGTGGTVTLPQNEWVLVKYFNGAVELLGGWEDPTDTATITLGTNIGNVASRLPLQARKENASGTDAGGLVRVEGSIENTAGNPVNGDTLFTLPAGHRPAFPQGFVQAYDPETNGGANFLVIEISTAGVATLRNDNGVLQNETIEIDLSFFAGN